MINVNADDLGISKTVTDRIINCYDNGRIHSGSLMVFMVDSDRAAELAIEMKMPIGLHLNFDQPFTAKNLSNKLLNHHNELCVYLNRSKWNQAIFNPLLINSFDYAFKSEWDTFVKLTGNEPKKIDGHHHMHLCMNMVLSSTYPKGIRIRRNFDFINKKPNAINKFYRYILNKWLVSRYRCSDYFFSIRPISNQRIKKIFNLSRTLGSKIELMVHPGEDKEYIYLLSNHWKQILLSDS